MRLGSLGFQFKPGWLGLPLRAKFAHAVAIFFASACASVVFPSPACTFWCCRSRMQLRSMPCASNVLQHRRLPSKEILERRRALLARVSASPCASHCCALQPAHAVGKRGGLLFSGCACFIAAIDAAGLVLITIVFARSRATPPPGASQSNACPPRSPMPIITGTFFETSGAQVMERPDVDDASVHRGRPPTRGIATYGNPARFRGPGPLIFVAALPSPPQNLAHSIF